MPTVQLHSLLTSKNTRNRRENTDYELDTILKNAFEQDMAAGDIPNFSLNALARTSLGLLTFRGESFDFPCWRLSELVERGGERRYLFEYRKKEENSGAVTYQKWYFLLDRLTAMLSGELCRSVVVRDTTTKRWSAISIGHQLFEDLEALTAFLFVLSLYEQGDTSSEYFNRAEQLGGQFDSLFPSQLSEEFANIKELYVHFKDLLDPLKANMVEMPLDVSPTCLNRQNNKMIAFSEESLFTRNDQIYEVADGWQIAHLLFSENFKEIDRETGADFVFGVGSTILSEEIEESAFALHPERIYTPKEAELICELPSWYVMPEKIAILAKLVKESEIYETPFRNVLLRGAAGCGKTEGTRALSALLHLPYVKMTGFPEMDMGNLTQTFIPRTNTEASSDKVTWSTIETFLEAMDGVELEFPVPDFSLISAMPDSVFEDLTGKEKEDATPMDCILALYYRLQSVIGGRPELYEGEQSKFMVVTSNLVKAFQYGYLVEFQEFSVIKDPGVLVGLNDILENGTLEMPNGEIVHRHPDCVVIMTSNYTDYAGVNQTNQSVLSRMQLKLDMGMPTASEMAKRIQTHVPQLSKNNARQIANVLESIEVSCKDMTQDGSVGTREGIDWAKVSYLLGNDNAAISQAAEFTILPSCTEDRDDQIEIRDAALAPRMRK